MPLRVVLNGDQRRPSLLPVGVTVSAFDPIRDAREVFRAYRSCYPGAVEDAWWSERVDDPRSPFEPRLWLVARAEGAVVGFAMGTPRPFRGREVAVLRDLGVVPGRRREGIGVGLVTRLMEAAEGEGLAVVAAFGASTEGAELLLDVGFS